MDIQLKKRLAVAFLLSLLIPATAMAVEQILDRVQGYNPTVVLDMQFDDPARLDDFLVVIDESGENSTTNFTTCKITAIDGLWCLDGKNIRHWPDPANPADSVDEFGCGDPKLGLDTKKSNTCTSMTVDLTGAVYIAGKNKGKTHSLIKVVRTVVVVNEDDEEEVVCPVGFVALQLSPDWCSREITTGRPLVVDMLAIDGDVADEFNPSCFAPCAKGKGTILLEQRTSAVFVTDSGATTEISGGKRDWTFLGNEKLQAIALVQTDNGEDGFDSIVLATTTKDRILAVNTTGTPDGRQVFDITSKRNASSTQCNFDDQRYGIRTSSKSGVIYVTDRNYCEFLALEPNSEWLADPNDVNAGLQNVQEAGSDLTLSTKTPFIAANPPDIPDDIPAQLFALTGPTLAPGVVIDLSQCTGATGCALVVGQSGNEAATLSNVQLVMGTPTGLTLLQVVGVPDCIVIPEACITLLDEISNEAELYSKGIILDPTGTDGNGIGKTPAAQLLNFARLLPSEVIDLFPAGLPDMWGQRWVRAKADRGGPLDNHYDLFFGITDATFIGAATLKLEIEKLTGSQLGCPTTTWPNNTPASVIRAGYDVIAKVSEDFISINRDFITGNTDHETHLINTGCGSTFGSIGRWSLIIINGEFPEETFFEGNLAGSVGNVDDAIFAKLILELFGDLVDAVDQLACHAVDGQASAPLSGQTCMDFAVAAADAEDKLVKCIDATKEPKTSQRNQNCQAAETHLADLQSDISMFALAGQDPANRIGEMNVRIDVIQNVYFNLFFPSIQDPEED